MTWPSEQTRFDNLTAHLSQEMTRHGVPGAGIGVSHGGRSWTAGVGVTNVDHPLLVTPTTLFQIGSITKTFMGTLAMRLVGEGTLELDRPVRAYLPEFRVADADATESVTVRNLLTHTAGWVGDLFLDTGEGDDAGTRYLARMADLPQLAPVGTLYSYNNAGFSVLGPIIETVTGMPIVQAMRTLLLDPLGLDHCTMRPADVMTKRFAVGHHLHDGGPQVATPWSLTRATWPAGGLITDVGSLLQYARVHMRGGCTATGEQLVAPALLAEMQRDQVPIWGADEAMGLTWFIDRRDGVVALSHTGGTVGQIALLVMVPAQEFALAVLTNAQSGGQVTPSVYHWCLRHYLGIEPRLPHPIDASPAQLDEYCGFYSRPMADLELGRNGATLELTIRNKRGFPTAETPPAPNPPPMQCALSAPDRLLVLDGPLRDRQIDLIRDATGTVRYARLGRLHVRQPAGA